VVFDFEYYTLYPTQLPFVWVLAMRAERRSLFLFLVEEFSHI